MRPSLVVPGTGVWGSAHWEMALSPQGQTLAQGPATEDWAKSSSVALKMGETWELVAEQTELNPEDICSPGGFSREERRAQWGTPRQNPSSLLRPIVSRNPEHRLFY